MFRMFLQKLNRFNFSKKKIIQTTRYIQVCARDNLFFLKEEEQAQAVNSF